MEDLNNSESEIYKKTLETQRLYISKRLNTIKNRLFDDTMGCCGEKEQIAKHLNMGLAQNLVQIFFKTADECVICNGKIGNTGIRQIERAHCNIYSRHDLLMMAINDLYIDNKVGIGTSNPNKTLTVVGDISANTINFSLIDGGTF